MKNFAKSLVSVVIALSVLATMCVIGVSAVAETVADSNPVGYTLVSANVPKSTDNVATMNPSVAPNTATVSVVNTSELTGGVSGVPSTQAYKVETVKKENGIVFPVSLSDAAVTDVKTNGGYVDAWIHVGEATASNVVIRMYKTGARNNGGTTPTYGAGREGSCWQGNSWEHSAIRTWNAGWYHFVWKINAGTDLAGLAELSVHDHKNGVNDTVNTVTFSVAAIRIVPTAADAEKAWAPAPAEPQDSYSILADASETNVTASGGAWDTANKQEGNASYVITAKKDAVPIEVKNLEIAAAQDWNGYFWFYIEDAAQVRELFWEISSDGKAAGACVRFIMKEDYLKKLKNGWNKIEFKLHDSTNLTAYGTDTAKSFSENYQYCLGGSGASAMTGNVDWSKINYVRLICNLVTTPADLTASVKFNNFTLSKPVAEPEKDANQIGTTIVSANLAKDEEAVTAITDAAVSVVKSSELKGGQSGVPSEDAYKIAFGSLKSGIIIPVENTDWTVPAKANLQNYGVNMWLWVSDASKVKNFVVRYYGENGSPATLSDWCFQWNSGFKMNTTLQTGWNNVTMWFPGPGTDFDRRVNGAGMSDKMTVNNDGSKIVNMTVCDYAAGDYEVAVACARLITTSDNANAGWTVGSGTGDAVNVAMVAVAILLAAMAASVTVYFGKKVR